MGEVDKSHCVDPGIVREPMCPLSSVEGEQSASDKVGVLVDRTLVENGCRADGGVEVRPERPCSPSCDGNGASAGERIRHLLSEQALPVEAPQTVAEEESYDFPGLSPILGGDTYAAELFDGDRDCNGCENALLVSSGSVADCSLINISGGVAVRADGFESMEADWIDERHEGLLPLKQMENQLFGLPTGQGLSLEYMGTRKEQGEADTCATSEETSTSLQEAVDGQRYPTLQLETEVSDSVQGSSDQVAPFSAVEGPAAQPSSHLTTAVENCSSKLSSDAGNGTSACRKPIIVFRRSNPKRAASLRSNLSDKKHDQLTRTKNVARTCTKAADTRTSILNRITNRITRKRSNSRRAARASVWGAVESLVKIFEPNNKLKIQNKRLKKGSGSGKKKRQAAWKDRSLQVSKTKSAASSNYLHTKDKRSPYPLSCAVVGLQASVQPGVNGCLAKSRSKIHVGIGKTVGEVQYRLMEQTCGDGVKSLQCDELHRDKDLESTLTQDTSSENMLGECRGVSCRSGTDALVETVDDNHLLDPGTSPDSDVYHPAIDVGTITSVCATPTNQDAGMVQCALVTKPTAQHGLHADVSTYSEAFVTHASVSPLDTQPHINHKRGKKKKNNDKVNGCLRPLSENLFSEQELNGPGDLNKATEASKYSIPEWKKQEGSNERSLCSKSIRKSIRNCPNSNSFQMKSSLLGMAESERCENSMKVVLSLENLESSGQDVGNAESEAGTLGGSLPTDKSKACKLPRDTKAGLSKGRSSRPDSARHSRRNAHAQKKEKVCKSGSKGKAREKCGTHDACIEASGGMSFSLGIASKLALTGSTELSCKTNAGSKVVPVDVLSSVMAPKDDELASKESCHDLEGQSLRPRSAWVLCDDCQKWRCIPAELADIINETNCKWTCKDNKDKAFADCCIPQEKTNAEINAELEISDASGNEDSSRAQLNFKAIEPSKPSASQPASWAQIKSNLFLHRNRKTQTIDEIMVCHCKPPLDDSLGCGEECLNRMLNIECVRGTCPCGNRCSNQKFQKRKYARFKWFRCGKKGYGLQLQEDVSCGQFLIEYVGEVLDFAAYEARQRYYASRGQKHFYFMTLNGGEVIDACSKGNFGRFINHSCDPNCRTEKWMINGEVCIGLFAIRDIKKGEEVTFDYKYVRVFGAAAKKCVCGSAECRGYIGGDPLNTEAIVQGDSDEEYLEPAMIYGHGERDLDVHGTVSDAIDAKVVKHEEIPIQKGDGEIDLDLGGTVSDAIDSKVVKHEENSIHMEDLSSKCPPTIPESEICPQREDTLCRPLSNGRQLGIPVGTSNPIQTESNMGRHLSDAEVLENSSHSLNSIQTEETMCRLVSDVQPLEVSLGTLSIPVGTSNPIQTKHNMGRHLSDAEVLENSSHSSNSIQTEETMCRLVSDVQPLEVSLGTSSTVNESISDSVLHNKKLILNNVEDKPNISKPLTKSSRSNATIKKARSSAKSLAPHKAKKMPTCTSGEHFEGVEEKLNELLDEDGGISKRKDATKGYLKLLVVTAAEGGNARGFASQSTRDLSLILDALLKTKSRTVLVDIISKNGLQMLHNIMKQNRSNFNRIPIIRKLLKVLEFLALKDILTLEHINRAPPCSGMESFKESILILIRHHDNEVHRIARNFRDRWMPRTIRRVEPSGREVDQIDSQRSYCNWYQSSSLKCRYGQGTRETEATVCISEAVHLLRSSCESDVPETSLLPSQQVATSVPLTDYNTRSEIRTRKRKSRWDHPSDVMCSDPQSLWPIEDRTVEACSKFMKPTSAQLDQTSNLEVVKQKYETHNEETGSCDGIASARDSMQQNVDDEAPPGFGSPLQNNRPQIPYKTLVVAGDAVMVDHSQKDDEAPPGFGSPRKDHHPPILSKTLVVAGDVVMAHLQERYLPQLTVSYGMPAALMQQMGTPEAEGSSQCHPRWAVAPGMPFNPFPPLPLYPCGKSNPTAPAPTSFDHNVMTRRSKEETQLAKQCHASPHTDLTVPSSSGERPAHVQTGARNFRIKGDVRWPSHGSGRRFFQPQRRSNQRFDRCWPPWPREGNNYGFRGSTRNGASSTCIGNARTYNSNGDVSSNFHPPAHRD